MNRLSLSAALACTALLPVALAQNPRPAPPPPTHFEPAILDLGRDAAGAPLERDLHQPLPEQYIGLPNTARPAPNQPPPHLFFRKIFQLSSVPAEATLYVAGPRSEKVWINGQLADEVAADRSSPLAMHTFATAVARFLHPGANTLALEVESGRPTRGRSGVPAAQTLHLDQLLVAKIVPAAQGVLAPALVLSDPSWKASAAAPAAGWEQPAFNDSAWSAAASIGSIEADIDLFQWNTDAGLYDWPGYDGISPFLAHKPVPAAAVRNVYAGRSRFDSLAALTSLAAGPFTLHLVPDPASEPPSLMLDFGRELTGRLQLQSDSDAPIHLTLQYGEDEVEALKAPFLGVDTLTLAPHATAFGPKSAFRFVKLRFLSGPPDVRLRSALVDHTFYPVQYQGSFESSDPLLNRIWETGAYTAHLCMQDDLWDAPKRDRGRWSGDNDISARVIDSVFADHFLLSDTIDRLIGPSPVNEHVNGIPGYSSFWFAQLAEYYRHTGDKTILEKTHARALELLAHMDAEFDANNIYSNKTNVWVYVDWSPELNGDTPESRRASQFEFYRGYHEAAFLLRALGDTAHADHYDQRAAAIKTAADTFLLDPATDTYGPRWQTNAMAILSGIAGPDRYPAIWNNVLSQVGHIKWPAYIISPYYNYYVISAMAQTGHRAEALNWIRQYWGGMVAEGATSFWEAYDPSWYKDDFHAALQSDNRSGYFVSLSHGWSSGPTAWLMEEVLGIHATGPGFSTVDIRPDLAGLAYARGAEPTPHGLLKVDITPTRTTLDLPEGITARVSLPIGEAPASGSPQVLVNGTAASADLGESGRRAILTLGHGGHYTLESR